MKTSKFIEKVESLGYTISKSGGRLYIQRKGCGVNAIVESNESFRLKVGLFQDKPSPELFAN